MFFDENVLNIPRASFIIIIIVIIVVYCQQVFLCSINIFTKQNTYERAALQVLSFENKRSKTATSKKAQQKHEQQNSKHKLSPHIFQAQKINIWVNVFSSLNSFFSLLLSLSSSKLNHNVSQFCGRECKPVPG